MHIPTIVFNAVWRCLAIQSRVDAFGSVEYHRVLEQWKASGQPAWSIHDIHERANHIPNEPRIINTEQLHTEDVRIGDLVLFVGGCPRFPGDRCDLVGGHSAVICEYKGELYYKVIA